MESTPAGGPASPKLGWPLAPSKRELARGDRELACGDFERGGGDLLCLPLAASEPTGLLEKSPGLCVNASSCCNRSASICCLPVSPTRNRALCLPLTGPSLSWEGRRLAAADSLSLSVPTSSGTGVNDGRRLSLGLDGMPLLIQAPFPAFAGQQSCACATCVERPPLTLLGDASGDRLS